MRNKIVDLLNQRRFNVMEMMQTRDPVAKASLAAHIAQLDSDIARQAAALADETEEVTQVQPVLTLRQTIYGDE